MGEQAKYRITAVATKTGLSPATLRAWERRYGLPIPRRTDSSYRVYSDEDVDCIRRVRELCDEGMSPAQAAKMVLAEQASTPQPAPVASGDAFAPIREQMLAGVGNFDPDAIEATIRLGMAMGSAPMVWDHLFAPVLREVGDRWHRGEYTVGQEHLASAAIETAARQLLMISQPPSSTRRVLLACFAEETHTLPLYGLALHLAAGGYRGVMLGARTPAAAVRQAVEAFAPVCVALSVTLEPAAAAARELVDGYADACGPTPWIVGGRGAGNLSAHVHRRGGSLNTGELPNVVATIDRLCSSVRATAR